SVSLNELYDDVGQWLGSRSVEIHLEAPVAAVADGNDHVAGVQLPSGEVRAFDFVILAGPWDRGAGLLSCNVEAGIGPEDKFRAIHSAPITSVHLWFDRPLTKLPHAVLVGRLSQWVFARSPAESRQPPPVTNQSPFAGYYYQVVISASHDLANRQR